MKRLSVIRQRGQGMTEYIIIVALIAIAAIAVYQYFGQTVRNQTAAIAQELAGGDGTTARDAAGTAADGAVKQGEAKTLKSYVDDPDAGAGAGSN
jgi:type IV pilus assembly protein PilA